MYIISIDEHYANLSHPRIIVYCFKKTFSGPDIFNLKNSLEDAEKRKEIKQSKLEKDRKEYLLFHTYLIENLRIGLRQLLKYEPFKSNQEFIDNVNQLSEELDRFTIRNYVNELLYFVKLEIPKTIYERYSGFSISSEEEYEIGDITHLSAHSLGDIYFSQGNYKLAKDFYTKAIFTHPLIASYSKYEQKDVNRTIYDLAKNAYKAEKKDEAYAFLIALMFDRAANDLYSRAVSRIRQPIEALFSWLIEKSDIQKASKVRSTKGLNLHVYRRLAVAFISLIFNS